MDSDISTAKAWSSQNSFNTKAVEDEGKLLFNHNMFTDIEFFIQCSTTSSGKTSCQPEDCRSTTTKKSWHVWSSNDSVLQCLQDVHEMLDCKKDLKLKEILDRVIKALQPLLEDQGVCEDGSEEEDDDEDPYYEEEDLDAIKDVGIKVDMEEQDEATEFFTGDGSPTAINRLQKDLKSLKKSEGKYGVQGEPRNDNLFLWDVRLTDFPEDSRLGRDLNTFAKKFKREPVIYLEMKFPRDYPMAPPFVRVIRPRIMFLTGHVTAGGSICMEMLTRSGWRPTNDIESILVQIRSEIMSDPNTGLDMRNADMEYNETEAKKAFDRMVSRYGWN